jgi:hypothetical protein
MRNVFVADLTTGALTAEREERRERTVSHTPTTSCKKTQTFLSSLYSASKPMLYADTPFDLNATKLF